MDMVAVPGKLKLKKKSDGSTKSGSVIKKSKKCSTVATVLIRPRDREAIKEEVEKVKREVMTRSRDGEQKEKPSVAPKKTKAEIAFENRQTELETQRILKKAEVSHKDRVDKFNDYLSSVPEINDIPKVSWTK